jgi:hypothetical protein
MAKSTEDAADNLKGPIVAAINAQIGKEYDRDFMIPEVTQIVRRMFIEMGSDFDRNKLAGVRSGGKSWCPPAC